MSEDEIFNVIPLFPDVELPPVSPKDDYHREGCHPCALVLNQREHTSRCSKCGQVYEAWATVMCIVQDWLYVVRDMKELRRQKLQLRTDVDDLQREIKNLKAQKRRHET